MTYPSWPAPEPTAIHSHMDGILTQWVFHRVQEHPKRSSDEEVMTFQSLRSHMSSHPYPTSLSDLPWTTCHFQIAPVPTALHSYIAGILTQWAFHIVQEHLKRSLNEEVMTFRSWRSHVVKPSRADLTWPS